MQKSGLYPFTKGSKLKFNGKTSNIIEVKTKPKKKKDAKDITQKTPVI
jgi:hypothetical protein